MNELVAMLKYRRPAGSATEKEFIDRFIRPLGVMEDYYGNLIKIVGDEKYPKVMWSSHTDTVHLKDGFQKILIDKGAIRLHPKEKISNCLGADCGAGVWIMTELIKAGKPGLYIFHREEECGAGGSSYIAKQRPEYLKNCEIAIGLDRYGFTSVITHQMTKTASNEFAKSLGAQISEKMKPDPNGLFTDTKNYASFIPECTNISVGYAHHHTEKELVSHIFIRFLLERLKELDYDKLIVDRDPKVFSGYRHSSWGAGMYDDDDYQDFYDTYRIKQMFNLILEYPDEVAEVLIKEFNMKPYEIETKVKDLLIDFNEQRLISNA